MSVTGGELAGREAILQVEPRMEAEGEGQVLMFEVEVCVGGEAEGYEGVLASARLGRSAGLRWADREMWRENLHFLYDRLTCLVPVLSLVCG